MTWLKIIQHSISASLRKTNSTTIAAEYWKLAEFDEVAEWIGEFHCSEFIELTKHLAQALLYHFNNLHGNMNFQIQSKRYWRELFRLQIPRQIEKKEIPIFNRWMFKCSSKHFLALFQFLTFVYFLLLYTCHLIKDMYIAFKHEFLENVIVYQELIKFYRHGIG